jgi:MFS family permease
MERLRRRGRVATLATISALRGTIFSIWGVIWQPFVLSLGVPMTSLGGLESLLDLTVIIVQPLVGRASDAYGRRRFIIVRDILILAAAVTYVFASNWTHIFIGVVFSGMSSAIYPVWNALIAESSEPSELGHTYSIIGSFHLGVGLVATLATGFVAKTYGFRTVFGSATFLGLLCLVVVWLRLPETMAKTDSSPPRWREIAGTLINSFKPPRYMWGWYAAMSLDLFAFNMGHRLLNGMLSSGYGFTPDMLGITVSAMTGAMALSQILLGRLADRLGYVRFLFLSQVMAVVSLGLVIFSKDFYSVIAAQVIMGVAGGLWSPAEQAWIASNVDKERRGQEISSYGTFRGLIAFPAPFIGGLLFDRFGFNAPIAINLVLALVDAVLILVLVKDRVRPPG